MKSIKKFYSSVTDKYITLDNEKINVGDDNTLKYVDNARENDEWFYREPLVNSSYGAY